LHLVKKTYIFAPLLLKKTFAANAEEIKRWKPRGWVHHGSLDGCSEQQVPPLVTQVRRIIFVDTWRTMIFWIYTSWSMDRCIIMEEFHTWAIIPVLRGLQSKDHGCTLVSLPISSSFRADPRILLSSVSRQLETISFTCSRLCWIICLKATARSHLDFIKLTKLSRYWY
jgi:hypothetical protein